MQPDKEKKKGKKRLQERSNRQRAIERQIKSLCKKKADLKTK